MKSTLPTIFIGSSVEGLPYAEAIFSELEREANPTIWKQNVFEPTKATLEVLENLPYSFDYAILVMTPDDTKRSRGKQVPVPRDNVVAELGLFIGALGRSRVFYIQPRDKAISLPSDFFGITPLEFASRDDNNLRAAVQTACSIIKSQIKKTLHQRTSLDGCATDVKFWHTVKDREAHGIDVRALICGAKRYVILTGVSLHYIVRHCEQELREAVLRKVAIGIIITDNTRDLAEHYTRYSVSVLHNLPVAQTMYVDFHNSLRNRQRGYFALYYTRIPLTHSIGLYDGKAYINEFWIDQTASICPSFSPALGSSTHQIVISEVSKLLNESRCVCGLAEKKLIRFIKTAS
jgi:hypothetical protein